MSYGARARVRKTGCLSPSSFPQYIPLLLLLSKEKWGLPNHGKENTAPKQATKYTAALNFERGGPFLPNHPDGIRTH